MRQMLQQLIGEQQSHQQSDGSQSVAMCLHSNSACSQCLIGLLKAPSKCHS